MKIINNVRLMMILSPLVFLSGCAVDKAGCDPSAIRDAGILTKMNCQFSGSYDARAKDLDAELNTKREINVSLKQALATLENSSALVSRDVAARRNQLAAINRSVGTLLAQVNSSGAQATAVKQQAELVSSRLAALQRTPLNQDKQLLLEVASLEKAIKELQEKYDQI